MAETFLSNASLEKFINDVRLSKERKKELISKLPEMDRGERVALLSALKDVYLLDLEEKEALERVEKFWQG